MGAFSSTNDFTSLLYNLFLSPPSLLPSATIKQWLRTLFINQDAVTAVGMPWEIFFETLDSGRNTEIFSKRGGIGTFSTFMTINRALGFFRYNLPTSELTTGGCPQCFQFHYGSQYRHCIRSKSGLCTNPRERYLGKVEYNMGWELYTQRHSH